MTQSEVLYHVIHYDIINTYDEVCILLSCGCWACDISDFMTTIGFSGRENSGAMGFFMGFNLPFFGIGGGAGLNCRCCPCRAPAMPPPIDGKVAAIFHFDEITLKNIKRLLSSFIELMMMMT